MPIQDKNLLFFDLNISGHHVEYLYHLIKYRITHSEYPEFVLLTHPSFLERVAALGLPSNWQKMGITVTSPLPEEMLRLETARSIFSRKKEEFRILRRYAEQYRAKCCYLMMLNQSQFVLGTDYAQRFPCVIRGILFNPFSAINIAGRFAEKCRLRATKFRKHIHMLWMLRNKNIDRIFVLNDPDSALYLNNRYHKKDLFVALPDPIVIPPRNDYHASFHIDRNPLRRNRFLLFGSLASRKGIFLVLDALYLLPDEITEQVEIVFAGKVVDEEYEQFRSAIVAVQTKKPKIKIILQNMFVPFKEVPSLFSEIDCVLMPYTLTGASSGVIGHSALYGKPVIGPSFGLIGKLIRSYGLGIDIEPVNSSSIAGAIMDFAKGGVLPMDRDGMRRFVEERQPSHFATTLIDL